MFIPANRVKQNGKVDLWDLGPRPPKKPEKPKAPDPTKLKDADLVEARIGHEYELERYEHELREHERLKREYLDWLRTKSGPVIVEFWGADASHAGDVEPERYMLDLPKGKAPGKAQREAEEMAEAEAEAMQRARQNDPQFGQPAGAPA